MIDIPKKSEESCISPFQEEVVLENYFAGADRAEFLARLQEGIEQNIPLLVMTGEEGSGKTMICRLLEAAESPSRKNVLISWSVDSFEDILRIIAMKLGLDAVIDQDGGNVDVVLEQIIEFLLVESLELFLIFDEAEDIYLATLERIRKMLDRVLESGVGMQVLFSGREIFLENFDQLSVCDFQNNDELLLTLEPLTEEETAGYLLDCERRLADTEPLTLFTAEVVNEIFTMAQGNFRMTNILAEESVRSPGDDTSFMVLLENVKDDVQQQVEQRGLLQYSELLKRGIPYLPWIGGGFCCLLILLLFFNSGQDEDSVVLDAQQAEKGETLVVMQELKGTIIDPKLLEPEEKVAEETIKNIEMTVATEPETLEEEVAVAVETQGTEEAEKNNLQDPPLELLSPDPEISQQTVMQAARVAEQAAVEKAEEIAARQISLSKMSMSGEESVEAERQPVKHKIVIEEGVKLVQLQAKQIKRKKPVLKARAEKSVVTSPVSSAVEQLYRERMLAGSSWKRKDVTNLYTVQLMVLAAEGAETNLKEMLAQVNYRQEAGNFYIFNKSTSPESLFVFYGEYPSIEMARLVKDSLPKFLRDHKPYALTIEKAVAKITR